ncbi:PH domain-containing protein [Streptomyces sp. B21-106]|uniref:PH domain-containing protein n=1 Tax=unclassified Streptomyces TaxID=2593676 RepID=UPI002FF0C52C
MTKDRVYRSSAGVATGAALLGLAAWLGVDAIVAGEGRTPWLALATLIIVVPLIIAFTLRPAVYAGPDRLRVRNPFRLIVLPWGQVATLRSGYSNEAIAVSGKKFQLWSIPVSLRERKRAARGKSGRPGRTGTAAADVPLRARGDRDVDELREVWEARQQEESAQGEVSVRWAWEILGPVAAGAVVLGILLAVG